MERSVNSLSRALFRIGEVGDDFRVYYASPESPFYPPIPCPVVYVSKERCKHIEPYYTMSRIGDVYSDEDFINNNV